jgi:hypothetical protein
VAFDEQQLKDFILKKDLQPLHHLGEQASPELIGSLTDFIG